MVAADEDPDGDLDQDQHAPGLLTSWQKRRFVGDRGKRWIYLSWTCQRCTWPTVKFPETHRPNVYPGPDLDRSGQVKKGEQTLKIFILQKPNFENFYGHKANL